MTEKENSTRGVAKIVAQSVSILLHPVFMPLACACLLYTTLPKAFEGISEQVLDGWLIMILINTIMFPVLLILLLKGLGFIKSIYLKSPRERVIPLIGTMVFYFWPYLVAKNVLAPEAARMMLLGFFWGIILIFLITIFFKVSMHSSGIGALMGYSIVLMLLSKSFLPTPLLAISLAAILIGWARYKLAAHSAKELWLGYIVGFACQMGAYLYLM